MLPMAKPPLKPIEFYFPAFMAGYYFADLLHKIGRYQRENKAFGRIMADIKKKVTAENLEEEFKFDDA